MKKFVSSILMIILLSGCATIKDKLPKRKACTGENKTISDILCKK